MPTHLLLFPQELRDEIYKYLLAPTGIITLTPRLETDIRRGSSPVTINPRFNGKEPGRIPNSGKLAHERIDLAFIRTCRQIYAECRELLFNQNTCFFRDPKDVEKVMREMGQKQSRRIEKMMVDFSRGLGPPTKIWYPLPPSAKENIKSAKQMKSLGKVVRKSLSRARQGHLREIGIVISGLGMMPTAQVGRRKFYEEFLSLGRKVEHWGNLKRYVDISMNEACRNAFDTVAANESDDPASELDHILMKLHFAWGGKLLFNGEVIWQNYCRVAEIKRRHVPEVRDDKFILDLISMDLGS